MVWESLKILVSVVQFRPEPPLNYRLVDRRCDLIGSDILGSGQIPPRATTISRYVLDRWFTERTDHIINTFGPKGLSSGSTLQPSKSKYPKYNRDFGLPLLSR